MSTRCDIGLQGEELVAQYLLQHCFEIRGRNMHARVGEIDILAVKSAVLHVVEVKTRTSDAFGGALEAINIAKLRKMKMALYEIQSQDVSLSSYRVQFDFFAVTMIPPKPHIDIFWNINSEDVRRR